MQKEMSVFNWRNVRLGTRSWTFYILNYMQEKTDEERESIMRLG